MDYVQLQHAREGFYLIPPHMHAAVERYLVDGISGGSFLSAVLANNFMAAVQLADDANKARLVDGWAPFIYNYLPAASHGSPADVDYWTSNGGLAGLDKIARELARK